MAPTQSPQDDPFKALHSAIRALADATDARLSSIDRRLDVIEKRVGQTDVRIVESEERVKRHFDVVAENHFHDLRGMHHDQTELLKDRVTRVEAAVGLSG